MRGSSVAALIIAGVASHPAHGECTRTAIDSRTVQTNIAAVTKSGKPISTAVDIGSGKTISFLYDLSDRKNGVVNIKNLIILAYVKSPLEIHYKAGALDFDFFPLPGASYCGLLVSGELVVPGDKKPDISPISVIYSYDATNDKFKSVLSRSNMNIDISGTTP